MRVCAIVKYPPIQGGVSVQSYWIARSLAAAGHQVYVVTNADEVEDGYRIWIPDEDRARLEASFPNGGLVRVTSTSWTSRSHERQVPRSDSYLTKLASLAADTIQRWHCEIIYSFYFEPYCMAGYLASQWTGVPCVIQHAGSDWGQLANHPELSSAYRHLLRNSAAVISSQPARLAALGIDATRVHPPHSRFLPSEWALWAQQENTFTDLIARLDEAQHAWLSKGRPLSDGSPVIAVYGKTHELKGTYDLISALGQLRRRGEQFHFLIVGGGSDRERLLNRISDEKLSDVTWTLPFLPHWRIPELIGQSTAVCCLERGFAVQSHTPNIPKEVFAAGTCLIVSKEIARKQTPSEALSHGGNCFIVPDPQDVSYLAGVLTTAVQDPQYARKVGAHGEGIIKTRPEEYLASHYGKILADTLANQATQSAHRPRRNDGAGRYRLPGPLTDYMPATVVLLGKERLQSISTVVGDGILSGQPSTEISALRARIEQRATEPGSATAEQLTEIVDFEYNSLWTRTATAEEDHIPQFPLRAAKVMLLSAQPNLSQCYPVTTNWIRYGRYRPDIKNVISDVRTRAALDLRTEDACDKQIFIFVKKPNLTAGVMRINQPAATLIDLCDGDKSAPRIMTMCARSAGVSEHHVLEALHQLIKFGVITV